MAKHNEDTRVKLPAILHLDRLGYAYLSLKDAFESPEPISVRVFWVAEGDL